MGRIAPSTLHMSVACAFSARARRVIAGRPRHGGRMRKCDRVCHGVGVRTSSSWQARGKLVAPDVQRRLPATASAILTT